jgi:hypothetical protein
LIRRLSAVCSSPASRVFGFAAALTLVSAWPLLRHFSSALPSDLGDPALETWIIWWNAQAIPLTTAWWNAPIYFPIEGAFTFSESLLGLAPLTTPLQWAGASAVTAHNVAFLLSGPLTALAAYQLAWQLTKRRDASLIAALSFGFAPYRIGQLPHMQVLWACWMPFMLAALHRFIDPLTDTGARRRLLVWFAVCWLLNGLTNVYFLVFFPVLLAGWMLWFVRRWSDAISIAIAAAIATLPILPLVAGYRAVHERLGFTRTVTEVRHFSADLSAVLAGSPRAWLSRFWTKSPGPEGELYPGIVIVLLVIAGGVVMYLAKRRSVIVPAPNRTTKILLGVAALAVTLGIAVGLTGGWDLSLGPLSLSAHRPSRLLTIAFWMLAIAALRSTMVRAAWRKRSAFMFYALAAVGMLVFAMGPEGRAWGHHVLYKPPYSWLMYLPGGDSVRVPARFGLLMILCLSQAGAIAFARLVPQGRTALVALAAAGILAEGWLPRLPVVRVPEPFAVPLAAEQSDALVLELPIDEGFEGNTTALLHQISHGHRMLNGFGGHAPAHHQALRLAIDDGDPTVLPALSTLGPLAVYVDPRRDDTGRVRELVAATPDARRVESPGPGAWFFLPPAPKPNLPEESPLLTIVGARASYNDETARLVFDGRADTRWHGEPVPTRDNFLTLDLGREVMVNQIELSFGRWPAEYARDFEILAGDITTGRLLWKGSTGGRAILASIDDPRNAPTRLRIDERIASRFLTLVSRFAPSKRTFGVAEVRAFGR